MIAAGIVFAAVLAMWLVGWNLTGTPPVSAGDEKEGPLELGWAEDVGFQWKDYEGEVAYRVSGYVAFLPPPSCGPNRLFSSERVEFDEELPADTTRFQLPPRKDERLTWRKDGSVTLEALSESGEVLERDGFAFNADKFCTPEEIAAAGTGPGDGTSFPLPAALAMLGASLLAGGLALRKAA